MISWFYQKIRFSRNSLNFFCAIESIKDSIEFQFKLLILIMPNVKFVECMKSGKLVWKFIDHKNHNVNKYILISFQTHLWVKNIFLEIERCKKDRKFSTKSKKNQNEMSLKMLKINCLYLRNMKTFGWNVCLWLKILISYIHSISNYANCWEIKCKWLGTFSRHFRFIFRDCCNVLRWKIVLSLE